MNTSLGMHEIARDIAAERAKLKPVPQDHWDAARAFLLSGGREVGHELSAKDIARLVECLRGPFANGMNNIDANKTLVSVLKWELV